EGRVGVDDARIDEIAPAGLRDGHVHLEIGVFAGEGRAIVGHRLQTILWQRKEESTTSIEDATLFTQPGGTDIRPGSLVDLLRVTAAAAQRIDIHPVSVITLDDGDLSGRKLVGILIDIRRIDAEELCIARIGIDADISRLPTLDRLYIASGPLGNCAF